MIRFIHPAPVSSGGIIKAMFVPQNAREESGLPSPCWARNAPTWGRSISTSEFRLLAAASGLNARPASYEASGNGLPCCALWMEDGTIPKYLRKTRLKCDELEKPHENATSVTVLPAWVSSSWRQFCNRACQI